jgi:hypothetical protein
VKGGVKEHYWPGTLMGLGIFVGLGSVFTVVPWTLVDPGKLFRFFLLLCFVGTVPPYVVSGWRFGMERLEWFLFNILAVGPLVTSALLWLNFLAHGPVTTTDHVVDEVEEVGGVLYYRFKDGFLEEHTLARSIYRDWHPIVGNAVHVSTADGLFGVPVVVRKEPFVLSR